MHQRRHHRIGIELHVGRIILIALQRHELAVEIYAFFRKYQPHLDRAHRRPTMKEFEHEILLPTLPPLMKYKARHRPSCLLYTSDAADDLTRVDLGGRRII